MASNVVGLDIGSSGVRAAELAVGKGGLTLERFDQVALPPGAVRDGEVVDVAAVAEAVRQLWSQGRFSTKKVVLGVANQKVVVRQVDLPWMPRAELKKSLAFQVQDFIPMPVEQAILDFHPLAEMTNEAGGRVLRVLLVAAARDMIQSALDVVAKAGLTAQMVDLNSFAVVRSLASTNHTGLVSSQAEALVDIGASITNIVVHEGGVPKFVRILLMGGADITDAVAERLGVPHDQAEGVKQSSALTLIPLQAGADPASRVIEASGCAFVEEVRGSLDYYLAQPGATRIGRVVLSGGGSRLGGLAERLSVATRLPVEAARPLALLKMGKTGWAPPQLDVVEPIVAVPVGLAMGVCS